MANTMRITEGLPAEARGLMVALGADLRLARKRRRISLTAMAERLMVSPPTLRKLERGDPTVSLGVMVTALWALGLGRGLAMLAAPETDALGLRAELRHRSGKRKGAVDELDF
ncbi:MAG: helix-turn-helix transcriptional regulator [Alphaproteobacteria bacterium]|nr:helix-turn-helix transcriptional regulator [Alphaproteobacteria bacterium]MBF0335971.1 helix-turn-helix transcriptional regulator [Alphaproteobacteria bacterium]